MIHLLSKSELAYLVHDIQNDSHKEGGNYPNAGKTPGNAEYLQNHERLLEAARAAGLPIFFTGHWLREDYADAALHANSPSYGALKGGTWGAEIVHDLAPRPGEWVIRKGGGVSAFTGTPLEKWLRRLGVGTLIVAGSGTHVGVESTVRDARERDFYTVVVSDACRSQQEHHEASLFNMSVFSQVGTTEEVVEAVMALA